MFLLLVAVVTFKFVVVSCVFVYLLLVVFCGSERAAITGRSFIPAVRCPNTTPCGESFVTGPEGNPYFSYILSCASTEGVACHISPIFSTFSANCATTFHIGADREVY